MPVVIAHRGDSKHYPENTLEAFLSAVHMGVDVIETDVHLTKDGKLVVWHDEDLARNTDGSGIIEDHTLAEVKSLDAGYQYSANGKNTYPFRGKGVHMITLDEALDACPTQRFNVDLKSKNIAIADACIDVVRRHNAEGRVLCASFHLANLKRVRRFCPDILTSVTTAEVLALLVRQKLGLLPKELHRDRTLVFQIPTHQWGIEIVSPSFIDDFHHLGAVIQVWTINDQEKMRRLFGMGVDAIMTDDPTTVIRVAEEMGLRQTRNRD